MQSFQKKLFHFYERIGITTAERRFILALSVILIFLHLIRSEDPTAAQVESMQSLVAQNELPSDSLSHKDAVLVSVALPASNQDFKEVNNQENLASTHTQEPNTLLPINTATIEQLQQLPGIGPVYAQRIVDYRAQHGAFQSINQLKEVKGIGPAKLQKIRPFIVVDVPD